MTSLFFPPCKISSYEVSLNSAGPSPPSPFLFNLILPLYMWYGCHQTFPLPLPPTIATILCKALVCVGSIDLAGLSQWTWCCLRVCFLLQGEKLFYLIPPTEENLLRYEEWVSSSNQSEVFFGDMTSSCYLATIRAGNTFFIPAGF